MLRQFLDWLESGEKTPADLLSFCLRRIREADPGLRAWVTVSPQAALGDGALRGIPFGAKDIFDTRDLATGYGSPIYAGRKAQQDAALVSALRNRGAVLVGKTQTTAFAYFDPAPTRNPRDPQHTPGGSSSGSAAAIAAGMVPFALGTQTQGSVLRPASYCGVVGFKPTYGLLPLEGVLPFAPTLDTAGLFVQTAEDLRLLWLRMGYSAGPAEGARLAAPAMPWEAEPEMKQALETSVARLRAAGFPMAMVDLPAGFPQLLTLVRLINDYEGARTHHQRWKDHGHRIGNRLALLVEKGLQIPAEEYAAALEKLGQARRQMSGVFREVSVLLSPAATGPAPRGLESTGDPRMNAPWTGLGVPAISLPMPVASGLPLGLQLTAEAGQDALLVEVARRVETALQRP